MLICRHGSGHSLSARCLRELHAGCSAFYVASSHCSCIQFEEFEHLFGANTASDQQMLQNAFDSVDKNKACGWRVPMSWNASTTMPVPTIQT